MNRKIITKGFYQHENGSKTITLNGETIKGDWIEGYYACGRWGTTDEEISVIIPLDTVFCPVMKFSNWKQVIPETVSEYINLDTTGGESCQRIYENDIIEFTLVSGTTYRYLIWYCREMNFMEFIDLKGLKFDGFDFWGNIGYIGDLAFRLQDHYGCCDSVKVIGNIFETPELLEIKEET